MKREARTSISPIWKKLKTGTHESEENEGENTSAERPVISFKCVPYAHESTIERNAEKDVHIPSEVLFDCLLCDYKCYDQNELEQHLARHQNVESFVSSKESYEEKEKGVVCTMSCESFANGKEDYEEKEKAVVCTMNEIINTMYKCTLCRYETRTKHDARKHALTHSDIQLYECSECDFGSNRKVNLCKHLYSAHNIESIEESRSFITEEEVSAKMDILFQSMQEVPITIYDCSICGYQTKDKSVADQHVSFHMDADPGIYKCCECSFVTDCKYTLKVHMLHHRNMSKIKRVEEYDWRQLVTEDIRPVYDCSSCSFSTSSRERAKIHFVAHSRSQKLFQCSECKEHTNRKYTMHKHVVQAHNKSFAYAENFYVIVDNVDVIAKACFNEVMTTVYERWFICSVCKFETVEEFGAKKHVKNHSYFKKEDVFYCLLCNFKEKRFNKLKLHLNKKHAGYTRRLKLNEKAKKFTRSQKSKIKSSVRARDTEKKCQTTHSNEGSLKGSQNIQPKNSENRRDKHSKRKFLICSLCSFRCDQETELKAHLCEHKSLYKSDVIECFECSKCDYQTNLKHMMGIHFLLHVEEQKKSFEEAGTRVPESDENVDEPYANQIGEEMKKKGSYNSVVTRVDYPVETEDNPVKRTTFQVKIGKDNSVEMGVDCPVETEAENMLRGAADSLVEAVKNCQLVIGTDSSVHTGVDSLVETKVDGSREAERDYIAKSGADYLVQTGVDCSLQTEVKIPVKKVNSWVNRNSFLQGVKFYTCSECNYITDRKTKYQFHIEFHHKLISKIEIIDKKYNNNKLLRKSDKLKKVEYENAAIESEDSTQERLSSRKFVRSKKRILCPECNVSFYRRSNYKNHLKRSHFKSRSVTSKNLSEKQPKDCNEVLRNQTRQKVLQLQLGNNSLAKPISGEVLQSSPPKDALKNLQPPVSENFTHDFVLEDTTKYSVLEDTKQGFISKCLFRNEVEYPLNDHFDSSNEVSKNPTSIDAQNTVLKDVINLVSKDVLIKPVSKDAIQNPFANSEFKIISSSSFPQNNARCLVSKVNFINPAVRNTVPYTDVENAQKTSNVADGFQHHAVNDAVKTAASKEVFLPSVSKDTISNDSFQHLNSKDAQKSFISPEVSKDSASKDTLQHPVPEAVLKNSPKSPVLKRVSTDALEGSVIQRSVCRILRCKCGFGTPFARCMQMHKCKTAYT